MIHKLILATLVLMLAISVSVAADPKDAKEPGAEMANLTTGEAIQVTNQSLQTGNDSLFLEDFNSVNDPYKETLFATGQGQRNESINYYENLTNALTAFQKKYEDFRPEVINADKQFSGEMMNVSEIISGKG